MRPSAIDFVGILADLGLEMMRHSHRHRIGLLLILACSAHAGSSRAGDASAKHLRRHKAVIVGSSSIRQAFGRIIARALERRGFRVLRQAVTAAGLARPDFRNVSSIANALPIDLETAAVFVYLGVNDAQALRLLPHERSSTDRRWLAWADPRWSAVYERRTRRFIEQFCARGAERVIMLLPVDVTRARLQRRLQRVRKIQARAAAASSCGKAIWTSGDSGRFEEAGIARRWADGVHMTAHGARLVWERIRARALGSIAGKERSGGAHSRANSRRKRRAPMPRRSARRSMVDKPPTRDRRRCSRK